MGEENAEHARAKLTRRLRIVGRRDDGYHLLDAEMVTIDLADLLEFSEGDSLEVIDQIPWRTRPIVPATVPADGTNLVARALRLLGQAAAVRLCKRIPPGGGLGGGSADAAAVLRRFGVADLTLGARLGADVPFCMLGGRASVKGVGEVVEELGYEKITIVLATPAFGISTLDAYRVYDDLERAGEIPPDLLNDLEPAAMVLEPRLAQVRDLFAEAAGERPALAGSGSSYFLECSPQRGARIAAELAEALREEALPAVVRVCTTTPADGPRVATN